MSTVTCLCGETYPLLPNLTLRRPAGLRLAGLCCPWCGHVQTVRLERPLWDLWRRELTRWHRGLLDSQEALVAEVASDG